MITTLDQVVEHTQTSLSEAETRGVDSATGSNHPSAVPESRIAPGLTRHDFGSTLTQTFNIGRQPESVSFTAFVGRFDGLRIPPSPLNEY